MDVTAVVQPVVDDQKSEAKIEKMETESETKSSVTEQQVNGISEQSSAAPAAEVADDTESEITENNTAAITEECAEACATVEGKEEVTVDETASIATTNEQTNKEHPYKNLIDNFKIPELYFKRVKKIKVRGMDKVPCVFISTKTMLTEVVEQLMEQKELGVAVKYNAHSYMPRLCLVQIASRGYNYLIDCIKLQSNLHLLGDLFANPKVLKIMHGRRFTKFLQLDYNLFFVNVFDTQSAMKKLKWKDLSLRTYIQQKYNVRKVKDVQLNKWHLRPLPELYKVHAIIDMHYLIPTFYFLKNKLINKGLMEEFLNECNRFCAIVFSSTNTVDHIFPGLRFMLPSQAHALLQIEEWRHRVARRKKKNVEIILRLKNIRKLIQKMPVKNREIVACTESLSVAQDINEIRNIMLESKKVIGPVYSRFAGNVTLVDKKVKKTEDQAEKKEKNPDTNDTSADKKASPVNKGKPPVNRVNPKRGAITKPTPKRKFVPKMYLDLIEKMKGGGAVKKNYGGPRGTQPFKGPRMPRMDQGFRYVPSVSNRNFRDSGDTFVDNRRRNNFNRSPDRRTWRGRSPQRNRNLDARPPIWEQPSVGRQDVWDTPLRQQQNNDGWNNSNNLLNINKFSDQFNSFGHRNISGNSNNFGRANSDNFGRGNPDNFGRGNSDNFGRGNSDNFGRGNSDNFGRASFGNNQGFNNRFANSENVQIPSLLRSLNNFRPSPVSNFQNMEIPSLFRRRDDFQPPSSNFRNFDKPGRNSDIVSYPKYNPSRYNKQGYY